MPRWLSVAAMLAASAFVAPVSTHYLSARSADPTVSAVVSAAQDAAHTEAQQPATRSTGPAEKSGGGSNAKVTSPSLEGLQQGSVGAEALGRKDIAELVCAYLHQPATGTPEACDSSRMEGVQVMIATVPDPVHTRLALRFDREIDVVEDELQELGWIYDRSWLPWDNKSHKTPDRWRDRALDSHLQDELESLPGVLLFRRDRVLPDEKRPGANLFVVLLVGEVPTGGINTTQFEAALQYWRQPGTLAGASRCEDGGRPCHVPAYLNLLGPSFSGSLPSLDAALRSHFPQWPASTFALRIASGTVSDGEVLALLARPYQATVKVEAADKQATYGKPDVTSFYPASIDLSRGLSCFLTERNPGLKIAQVREKESGFGAIRSGSEVRPCESDGNPQPAGNFHYPREISQLRRAYEQNSIVGFSASAGAPRNQLQLLTEQDDRGSDSVAMFAGSVDAVALEADLAALTHELAEDRYSVVLLSGTDVMDEVFVARYLSQHAPNLTVVIEDTDQLFLHEGPDASLNNVYVASPWPLLWQNRRWSSRSGAAEITGVRFASASNQGVAAAMHHLVCTEPTLRTMQACPETFKEYRSPFAEPGPTTGNRPPVWLSLIEHGSFLPVALLNSASNGAPGTLNLPAPAGAEGAQPAAAGIDARTGFPVKVLAAGIVCLLLWHGWACYHCRLDRRAAWTYALAEQEHHRIRLAIKCSLSLVSASALALLFIPAKPGLHVQSWVFQDCLIAGQILAVLISALSMRKLAEFERPTQARVLTSFFAGLSLLLLWIADYELWPWLAPAGTESERLLFLYRAANPFSGGSPAMPLLLMTAAAAVVLHGLFARLAFFGHRIPKLPDRFDYVRCPSSKTLEPLTYLLANMWDARRWWTALACVLAMGLLQLLSEQYTFHSLANGPFDVAMTIVLVLAGAVILQNLAMAWRAWNLLRHKLLIPLKQSPLRWGFNWVKDFSWRRIWRSSKTLSSTQVFDYLFRLLQASSRRPGSGTGPMYYAEICALYKGAEDGAPSHKFTQGVEDLQGVMQLEAQSRLERLQFEWQADRGPLTGSKEANRGLHLLEAIAEVKGKAHEGMLRRMGDEEFVALIYVGYISMVLIQIRQRVLTAATLYILLLWSLTNYPWMYRHTILLLLVALFAVLAAVTLMIYSGMHRDEILSRTTETETGKLDGGFLARVLAVLGVPLLTLVASQFPEVNSFIFSWLQPSLSKLP